MSRTLFVTGASGQLGRLVVQQLAASKDRVIAGTRTPEKFAGTFPKNVEVRRVDFDEPQSLDTALAGVDRLLIISTDAIGKRFAQHKVAIEAAQRAGVKHVVYTSLAKPSAWTIPFPEEHKATEAFLAASGLGYTVLRNNFYMDLLLGSLPGAVASGQLYSASGEGRIGYITREDCAKAAAAALTSTFEGTRTLEISGSTAVTAAEIAKIASEVTGRPVTRVGVSAEQFAEGMQKAGMPAPWAQLFSDIEVQVSKGALDQAGTDFKQLTGSEPTTVREFLEANKAALLGNA